MVGGRGTRLGDLTRNVPKPLLEIAPGVRFLDVLIEEAARMGFTDILLLAGHMGDQVEEVYQGRTIRGASVKVVREPEPQGTGGAIGFAKEHLQPFFLLSNGDSLFEINLRDLARPLPDGVQVRMALRRVPDPARYGAVETEGERVTAFREKSADLVGPALINGGIYFMDRRVTEDLTGPCSIESDIFPKLVEQGTVHGQEHDGYFIDMGLPDTYEQAQREVPGQRVRPCLFLDRDGVLNVDKGYTHKADELEWMPGARETIKAFNDAGHYVIVVTNQAGIARGYYTEEQMHAFHEAMKADLATIGAYVDDIYFCPYHADGSVERYTVLDHPDRKPNPGMILRALQDWPIDGAQSFLVGDKDSDIAAAKAAGISSVLYSGGNLLQVIRESRGVGGH